VRPLLSEERSEDTKAALTSDGKEDHASKMAPDTIARVFPFLESSSLETRGEGYEEAIIVSEIGVQRSFVDRETGFFWIGAVTMRETNKTAEYRPLAQNNEQWLHSHQIDQIHMSKRQISHIPY
jgi:hypothetical protein